MLEAPKDRKVLSMERTCETHQRHRQQPGEVSHQRNYILLPRPKSSGSR